MMQQFLFISTLLLSLCLVNGCQLVKIQENKIKDTIRSKSDNILTQKLLSNETLSLLHLIERTQKQCLNQFDDCIQNIQQQTVFPIDQRYSVLSELYLAHALDIAKHSDCKSNKLHIKQQCIDMQLQNLDLSLRYSYAYLFQVRINPESNAFDQRQMHVRNFYNVALSQLISKLYQQLQFQQLPEVIQYQEKKYIIDSSHYPELKQMHIDSLQSSYNFNFSGFDQINRQEGLGSEFIINTQQEQPIQKKFILDPDRYYKIVENPNIHPASYLSATATIQPVEAHDTSTDIIHSKIPLKISFYNPYKYKTAQINQKDYTITANYTAPFAFWLANNQMAKAGQLSLMDRVESLRMPHIFMLEPYQANKKVIVLIHGLASSPETWINLTNSILADQKLRQHYQVWHVQYSTNMPIFESRFQIHAILKQAFAQLDPHTASSQDAVLIGHSMGGIISRLLVSDADISAQAIPLLKYEQYLRLQENPVIRERFQFHPDLPFSRAIFIAAPHRGSQLADQWYMQSLKKLIRLPTSFAQEVDLLWVSPTSTQGLIQSGPDDLSPQSRFMQLTQDILPAAHIRYHSIMGNHNASTDHTKMSDGIVPYHSSHLAQAESESIFKGGHSIQEKPATILELRRILHEHLKHPTLKTKD